ncbi:MAG: phosphatidylserine decarboxylase [Rhizobiales bacterium]|nr:phosphatidylserine decarboxylase [Hyphomicrobiales bacterium]
MTVLRSTIGKVFQQEDVNFLLTNRIPRRLLTQFMGWFSKIEHPLIRDTSIGLWQLFSDLDLSEAKNTKFASMHDCFTRELKDGARPLDPGPEIVVSPCDAIVGACGRIEGTELLQIKGFPYSLHDLLGAPELVERHRDGTYVTLRLTSSMYHRFHAPHDCRVERVTYISGDTWNVNPIALKRIEKLFCKNERAVIETRLEKTGDLLTLVPVAAILVASIRLHCLDRPLRHPGRTAIPCSAAYRKGDEMGWFEHGSTIVVLAPSTLSLAGSVRTGTVIRQGQPLLRLSSA